MRKNSTVLVWARITNTSRLEIRLSDVSIQWVERPTNRIGHCPSKVHRKSRRVGDRRLGYRTRDFRSCRVTTLSERRVSVKIRWHKKIDMADEKAKYWEVDLAVHGGNAGRNQGGESRDEIVTYTKSIEVKVQQRGSTEHTESKQAQSWHVTDGHGPIL